MTVAHWLMTDGGYTMDRAFELVDAHMEAVLAAKKGGWNNREIAEKVVALEAGRLQFCDGAFRHTPPVE